MSSSLSLRGTHTALVTPFNDDEGKTIDFDALDSLVDSQVAAGVASIVVCGTTGESPTLSDEEQLLVIQQVVQRAAGRVPVIAGTGSAATEQTVRRSQAAEKAGVDGLLVVVPYYNRPSQDGLVMHFARVARAVTRPIIVYNVPHRTATDLGADAVARLCDQSPNVTGIKEAGGNVLRAQELAARLGDRLTILSGDDALALPMIAVGSHGVVSVTSNIFPSEVKRATNLALEGRMGDAEKANRHLMPVHRAMFLESNPGPIKAALALRGSIKDVLRSPLFPVSDSTRTAVSHALQAYAPLATR